MRLFLKWGGIVLGALVVVAVVAAIAVYLVSNARMNTSYALMPEAVTIAEDSASVAYGRHIATIRGCVDCHGDNLAGKLFIDAGPVAKLYSSNLTAGEGGIGAAYSDVDWVRAIRHGVGADGKPLLFMPSQEFYYLSDEDLGAMLAYLKSLPAVDNVMPASTVGPLGRVLYLAGELPLLPAELIDHEGPRPVAPPAGVTVEYGKYMSVGCLGCHGNTFSGGKIPGAPPEWPAAANLTPDVETGLGNWTQDDFFRAVREGKRPDGTELRNEFMPWKIIGEMTDEELAAIWTFLQSLEPKPVGNR